MSKHYRFKHNCGHIGIGPLIRAAASGYSTNQESVPSNQAVPSISLPLPIRCPFCADSQPYLNVAEGDGLLAILEALLQCPYNSASLSSPSNSVPSSVIKWRILRICAASEILPSDWSLAHAPGQRYRQMAWIPKPCGTVRLGTSDNFEGSGWIDSRRELHRSCRQHSRVGGGIKSRLPGMWSNLKASLVPENENGGSGSGR